eukprot:scaffold81549_cov50-Phaeocystis_antarctica.AAC.2
MVGRCRVRVRVRVSGSGRAHLRVSPPPGCRGTTTVGQAARATHGALIKTCRSAGEAWAGPGVGARAAGYSPRAFGVCRGAATLDVWLVPRVACGCGPTATAQAQVEVRFRAGVRVRVRVKVARVSGSGRAHLRVSPPPGCRGTNTVGVAARATREA